MTHISSENNIVTTINVFTVLAPEYQQEALDLLLQLAAHIANTVPDFLSANFHKSIDGMRLINYAQYSSHEAVLAVEAEIAKMVKKQPAFAELRKFVAADFRTYEVVSILEGVGKKHIE
jgi:hypothetical protein